MTIVNINQLFQDRYDTLRNRVFPINFEENSALLDGNPADQRSVASAEQSKATNPNVVWLQTPRALKIHMPVNVKEIRCYTNRPPELGGPANGHFRLSLF